MPCRDHDAWCRLPLHVARAFEQANRRGGSSDSRRHERGRSCRRAALDGGKEGRAHRALHAPLTDQVVAYIEDQGFIVTDSVALEIPDNLEVGAQDPGNLETIIDRLDHDDADVVIISACVQMPSLAAVQTIEDRIGKPVISAAIATTFFLLKEMGLEPVAPNAGALLSGVYA